MLQYKYLQAQPFSWGTTMTLAPQDFVSKWKRVTAREKQIYQEHFIDLCHLVGHQMQMEYDPSGVVPG